VGVGIVYGRASEISQIAAGLSFSSG